MTNIKSNCYDESHEEPLSCFRSSSQIFRRNRAMGYVSNNIPAVIRYVRLRKDTLITTCIGRSFHVYNASKFRLIHVSSLHPDEITAIAVNRFFTYTASAKCIYVWKMGKHVRHILRGHDRSVHLLMPFGKHLIAIDEGNILKVWDYSDETVYMEKLFDEKDFKISALTHPPTYVDKILLGSQQGQLQLWNIKKNKCIYAFSAHHQSRITCLEPAPAIDVIAIGYQDGHISLLNLKFNEILMEFNQDWGDVTQLSFRTDGPPILATSSRNGHVAFWNLEERKIVNQSQAHEDAVTTTICFPNEPLMLTTSPDNSMKLWIFDLPDGAARLLRLREGHTGPPLCIRYHGSNGVSILSSGEDSSLRVFSTLSESLNRSMGKASYNRKASKKKNRFEVDSLRMPPIVEFTSETTREKEWDNIAAIHSGVCHTTTWSFHKGRMGEHRLVPQGLKPKSSVNVEATCVTLTHCGNFVIIGYSTGDLQRFNIQSGIYRACYGNPAHKSAIRGVVSDNLNQLVVSGCNDGLLKFWPFKSEGTKTSEMLNHAQISKPNAVLKFANGIALMRLHRESGMIAVVLVNFVIHIIDAEARVAVRKFEGHTANINDVVFSPDSRWLLSAAMDSTIKVWDIPSSYMVDHFRVERPCVSLTMSPNGDSLATAHVGYLGIYLWSNKTLFSRITLHSIDPHEPAPFVGLPTSDTVEIDLEDEMKNLSMDVENELSRGEQINAEYETPKQIDKELITLSGLAASRWQNLLDLELIKKRNKPRKPPKVPKQAPFFLPTVTGLNLKFDLNSESNAQRETSDSRILNPTSLSTLTKFGKLLLNRNDGVSDEEHFASCVSHLKELGPSMIDFEIKSLHPLSGGSEEVMIVFLKVIDFMFKTNLNFELAQSYLSVFLRAHGLGLLELPNVIEELKKTSASQEVTWNRIEENLLFGMGVVAALRNFAK